MLAECYRRGSEINGSGVFAMAGVGNPVREDRGHDLCDFLI